MVPKTTPRTNVSSITGAKTTKTLVIEDRMETEFDNLTGEDYTVYVGMFNPTGWGENGKVRLADIKINGETLQTGYNYYTSCTGKGDTLAFTGLKSDADGVLTVEVAANANTTSAVQVSFIMVSGEVKTPEPAPETKTEVVKDTLTKDNIPQGIKDKGYDTPEKITEAFKKAIEAGRAAYLAGLGRVRETASASSPLTGFLQD